MATIVDRLKLLLQTFGLSENKFATEIGVRSQTLNTYTSGKRSVSYELVDKILGRYPQVSAEWLLRGIGQMFCPTETKDINEMFDSKPQKGQPLTDTDKDKIIVSQQETIASQQETIRLLQNIIQNGMQPNK